MAGEYEVLFNFRETVAYVEDYKLADHYQEDATETVLVIEDTGSRIALQHLLQVHGGRVVKHWKQVWTWEDDHRWEYLGDNKWKGIDIGQEERRGAWTQLVTHVDDSPRYEGVGRWIHQGGVSLWESNRVGRPLPRREYTTRDDYDLLMAVNRHTITRHGWTHEQDNLKTILNSSGKLDHYLVREEGVNYYDRTEEVDFEPARKYWGATREFWSNVSAIWASKSGEDGFAIQAEIDGKTLWEAMFALAKPLTESEDAPIPDQEAILAAMDPYLDA